MVQVHDQFLNHHSNLPYFYEQAFPVHRWKQSPIYWIYKYIYTHQNNYEQILSHYILLFTIFPLSPWYPIILLYIHGFSPIISNIIYCSRCIIETPTNTNKFGITQYNPQTYHQPNIISPLISPYDWWWNKCIIPKIFDDSKPNIWC
jgi:hypothetical protein